MSARPARRTQWAALLLSLGMSAAFAAERTIVSLWQIDENLLAHRLLQDGRAAEAAEIFTDPAWKGIALYRSEQWWRAAEAFVRADDPVSAYNLGNCYVQLGYYALALDAYQRALTGDPSLVDAARNADLMRQLLADRPDGEQGGGHQERENAIDQLERDTDAPRPGGNPGDDRDTPSPAAESSGSDAASPTGDEPTAADDIGDDGQARGEGQTHERADRRTDGTGEALAGQAGEPAEADQAGGASESDAPSAAGNEATGLRAHREAEQADEQWLNRIQHDPVRYLDKRIRLEMRRRIAAGQSAPGGGTGW